jgi:hypothetical protein
MQRLKLLATYTRSAASREKASTLVMHLTVLLESALWPVFLTTLFLESDTGSIKISAHLLRHKLCNKESKYAAVSIPANFVDYKLVRFTCEIFKL